MVHLANVYRLLTVAIEITVTHQWGCSPNWFGEFCQYQCHCRLGACDSKGECSQCADGYFGPACQYVNLVYTDGALTNPDYLKNLNYDVCNPSLHATTVRLALKRSLRVSWIRIHVDDADVLQKFRVHLNYVGNECLSEKRFNLTDFIVDVTCDTTEAVRLLIIQGEVASHVCAIEISGGRNLALKQLVKQSSTLDIQKTAAGNAVNGKISRDMESGYCSSSGSELGAEWNITLSLDSIIYRIKVYNSESGSYMLQGMKIETMSQGSVVEVIDDTHYDKDIYDFTLSSNQPVRIVRIKASLDSYYLPLCEVQIFGEVSCPDLRYGISCNKFCRCKGHEACHVATGKCGPGCPFGYYGFQCKELCDYPCRGERCLQTSGKCYLCAPGFSGPKCDRECISGTYGPSCENTCSGHCEDVCDALVGGCVCKVGYLSPTCTGCSLGTYGRNCQNNCSSHCVDQKCNPETGDCLKCNALRRGPSCDLCPDGFFGPNCSEPCPDLCTLNVCDGSTGNCNECNDGRIGVKCEACPAEHYGPHCSLACPENCAGDSCHVMTGICTSCSGAHTGPRCETGVSTMTIEYVALLSVSVTAVLAVCLYTRCYYRDEYRCSAGDTPSSSTGSTTS